MEYIAARNCYQQFVEYLCSKLKCCSHVDENITNMDIKDIKTSAQILYMKYILQSNYSINENSIVPIAYKHLIEVIEDESKDTHIMIKNLSQETDIFQENKNDKKLETDGEQTDAKKSWSFF